MIATIGRTFREGVEEVGRAGQFVVESAGASRDLRTWLPLVTMHARQLGVDSLPIAFFIALFTGIVLALLASYSITGAVPLYFVGTLVEKTITLELAPVLTGLALAGRVGANIAAELGTMRVTEQIDALEVMGVNSLNYLVFPKLIALLLYPFVIGIAMFLGILGGWIAAVYGGFGASSDFIGGIQMEFIPFHIAYAFIKTFVFAILLATIPSFHGYYMKGGALEVGKASTVSFVWTSVTIILLNYILTQLLLSS